MHGAVQEVRRCMGDAWVQCMRRKSVSGRNVSHVMHGYVCAGE